ncbi:MAG: flippase-like domain-containing protein, partial [Chloroflexi bacterium]|nr:flippase-like domain-containing protein [Chloroflexota bacterium]
MTPPRLGRILRPAVSLALLGYILSHLDRQQLIALWPQLQPLYLLAALTLGLAMMLLSAYKWQLLLRGHGTRVSLATLFRFYLVGTFFNMFLPTSVGGDVRRVYDLTHGHANAELATASVLLDRATGVLAMLIIGSISVFFVPLQWRGAALLVLAGTATAVLVLGGAIFITKVQRLLAGLTNLVLPSTLRRRALAFLDTLSQYRNRKRLLGAATGIGLVFQSVSVFIVFLLSKSLGLHVSLLPFFLFVPVITLATMLPISLNGLGVQDAGYVFLFAQVGLSPPVAFSLSLLFHLYRATIGALGGLVYASGRRDS